NEECQELGFHVYNNYEEILAHPGLQAVWIYTSTDVHTSQSLAAVAKGVHSWLASLGDLMPHTGTRKHAIGSPFMVRSKTCDLRDEPGFFVRYAARSGGISVDCGIRDIDLSLLYLGKPVPKSCWAAGTLQQHPELKSLSDVEAHGPDVCTEITGTEGKLMVTVVPQLNNLRFQDAFTLKVNEFVEVVLKDKELPEKLETGIFVMKLGQGLHHALLTGDVLRFNWKGERLN
ncbi:hypothetical protein N7526_008611, partial [Penicillium atrosanguineum]